jgi:hypothetical protein
MKKIELNPIMFGALLVLVMGIAFAASVWPFNKASGDVLTADDWNEAVRVTGMAVAQKQTDIITADEWNALAGCINGGGGVSGKQTGDVITVSDWNALAGCINGGGGVSGGGDCRVKNMEWDVYARTIYEGEEAKFKIETENCVGASVEIKVIEAYLTQFPDVKQKNELRDAITVYITSPTQTSSWTSKLPAYNGQFFLKWNNIVSTTMSQPLFGESKEIIDLLTVLPTPAYNKLVASAECTTDSSGIVYHAYGEKPSTNFDPQQYKIRAYITENNNIVCDTGLVSSVTAECSYGSYSAKVSKATAGVHLSGEDSANGKSCSAVGQLKPQQEQKCQDTCESLNYECGIHAICGVSTNCGNCNTGENCISGVCIDSQQNQITNFTPPQPAQLSCPENKVASLDLKSLLNLGSEDSVGNLQVFGDYAYVGVHQTVYTDGYKNTKGGIQIIDVSNPASPKLRGYYELPGYNPDENGIGGAMLVKGNTLYTYVSYGTKPLPRGGAQHLGVLALDISDPNSPSKKWEFNAFEVGVSQAQPNRIIGVFGNYVYFQTGFNIYVIKNGQFVNLFTPENCVSAGYFVPRPGGPIQYGQLMMKAVWLAFSSPDSRHLYVICAEKEGQEFNYLKDTDMMLQVFNMNNPASPNLIGTYKAVSDKESREIYGIVRQWWKPYIQTPLNTFVSFVNNGNTLYIVGWSFYGGKGVKSQPADRDLKVLKFDVSSKNSPKLSRYTINLKKESEETGEVDYSPYAMSIQSSFIANLYGKNIKKWGQFPSSSGLDIVDVSESQSPKYCEIATYYQLYPPTNVRLYNSHLYAINRLEGNNAWPLPYFDVYKLFS